jgi:hypothetical protein
MSNRQTADTARTFAAHEAARSILVAGFDENALRGGSGELALRGHGVIARHRRVVFALTSHLE